MNKNDLRYIKTESLIQDSFLHAVEEVSFERVTVSLICSRARISRFTFYAHYEDKYQLKDTMLKMLEERLNQSIDQALLSHAANGNYYPSAERYVREIRSNSQMIKVLLLCDRTAVATIIKRTFLDSVTALYVDNYMDIVSKNTDVQFTRAFFSNALVGYAETIISASDSISEHEMIRQFYTLVGHAGKFYLQQLRSKTNRKE